MRVEIRRVGWGTFWYDFARFQNFDEKPTKIDDFGENFRISSNRTKSWVANSTRTESCEIVQILPYELHPCSILPQEIVRKRANPTQRIALVLHSTRAISTGAISSRAILGLQNSTRAILGLLNSTRIFLGLPILGLPIPTRAEFHPRNSTRALCRLRYSAIF